MLSKKRYIILAVAVFALIIFLSGPRVIAPTIGNYAINMAARNGVGLAIEDLKLGLNGRAHRVRVWTRKIPATEILNVEIEPNLFKLLQGVLSAQISGSLLDGLLGARVSRQRDGSIVGSLSLLQATITKHDLFMILPLTGGLFDLRVDSLSLNSPKPTALGSVRLGNLELTEAITLPASVTTLPVPVELPKFKLESASAVFDIQNGKAQLSDLYFASDLLKFKGRASGVLPSLNMIELSGCLTLLEQGVERFGSLMPFIGGKSSTEPQTLRITGSSLSRLKTSVTSGCSAN